MAPTTITTWVVPIAEAPPEATTYPDCGARARDVREDGVFVCTIGNMHGGEVHASHGIEQATLWRTRE